MQCKTKSATASVQQNRFQAVLLLVLLARFSKIIHPFIVTVNMLKFFMHQKKLIILLNQTVKCIKHKNVQCTYCCLCTALPIYS